MRLLTSCLLVTCFLLLIVVDSRASAASQSESLEELIRRKDLEFEREIEKEEESNRRVARDCPSQCSSHGTCHGSLCQCYEGWTGSDCSVEDRVLVANQAISDSVANREWNFYHITVQNPRDGLRFRVNQTSALGDADVFARKDNYPSLSLYQYRDVSQNKHVVLDIRDPGVGTWYLGVFGYEQVSYTVEAVTESACPNACNGRGRCISGVCYCNNGWGGDDCSLRLSVLEPNQPVSAHLNSNEWAYYSYTSDHEDVMVVHVQQSSGDADLYVKYGKPPTRNDFDARDISLSDEFEIDILLPQPGQWYVGVYGFADDTSFTLTISQSSDCPNQCSGPTHGSCVNQVCSCKAAFLGEYCQNMVDSLKLDGTAVQGFVDRNAWNYFHVDASTSQNILVRVVEQTPPDGAVSDCDLYVRRGQRPSIFQYDYQDIEVHTDAMQVTIEDPGQDTWYIGVYGYETCTFTVQTTVTDSCPNACSSHGQCEQGRCLCDSSWAGDSCMWPLATLRDVIAQQGQVNHNEWHYYSYSWTTELLLVTVHETNSAGFISLYASYMDTPTSANFDLVDDSSEATHYISGKRLVLPSNPEPVQVIVGVYANAASLSDHPTTYSIVAWEPFFSS